MTSFSFCYSEVWWRHFFSVTLINQGKKANKMVKHTGFFALWTQHTHNTHFKTVVSSLGCFHDLHWPLNCINLLLSHRMVSFTALFCLHQFLIYKEHWPPHCFCSLQHWCVLMNLFIKYQQSLSLTYLLYCSLSDTYSTYTVSLCVCVCLSLKHTQTHNFSSITLLSPCWLRWQLKPLPNWLAVKHHFAPVIQMSSPDYVFL